MYSGGYYMYSGVYHMYSGVYYTVYNPPLPAEDDNQPKPVCSSRPRHQTCLLLQTWPWVAPKWTEPNNVQLIMDHNQSPPNCCTLKESQEDRFKTWKGTVNVECWIHFCKGLIIGSGQFQIITCFWDNIVAKAIPVSCCKWLIPRNDISTGSFVAYLLLH